MFSNRQTATTDKDTAKIVGKIKSNGVKISEENVLRAWEVPPNGTSEFPPAATSGTRPQQMWIEKGNERSGLQHIQKRHQQDYVNKGIPIDQQPKKIPELAEASTKVGRHIGWGSTKRDQGRPVMATCVKDMKNGTSTVYREAVTVANNGFVVGTQPIRAKHIKRQPGEPKDVSDRTIENLYFYPPNVPDRRSTGKPEPSTHTSNNPKEKTPQISAFTAEGSKAGGQRQPPLRKQGTL